MVTNLIPYGIQNENSDFRIHVCPLVRRLYLYETSKSVPILASYPTRPAYQVVAGRSVLTANGHLVPFNKIPECTEVALPDELWSKYPITESDSTSVKGIQAVEIVRRAVLARLLILPLQAAIIEDKDMQIDGTDIIIHCSLKIQVKCDYRGGNKSLGGTGNLYLQIAEINPLKAK